MHRESKKTEFRQHLLDLPLPIKLERGKRVVVFLSPLHKGMSVSERLAAVRSKWTSYNATILQY